MATPNRGSIRSKIPAATVLAAADDLDGTDAASLTLDVSGTDRVLIVQDPIGTAGTAGIDVIEISKDDGESWSADDTLLALASDDVTGTAVASAALNAAGVEAAGATIFKSGPHKGKTMIRCARTTTTTGGTTWVTGSPQVIAIVIGA